jgi:enoyl-CoA hydratase/carnithine racemase
LFTGDFIDAATAECYHLINQAVAPDELDDAANELAIKIAGKPPDSIAAGKKLFYQQIEQGMTNAYESAGASMACNMMAQDTIEGIDAFIEKRPPNWR